MEAADENTAANLLDYGGYQVIKLKQASSFLSKPKFFKAMGAVKAKDIIMFSRQLALLLESGTDIVTSLELLENQVSSASFRSVLKIVVTDLRSGNSLSTAMSKHHKIFPEMYYHSLAAGEQSGNLDVVLRQMADYMERNTLAQKKIKGAMTYPILVGVVGLVVAIILVTFVLPTFVDLYGALGAKLPWITAALISASKWLIKYGLYILLGMIAVVIGVFLYGRSPEGKFQIDTIKLTMPVIGRIVRLTELSRACRTISLLFRVGLPLPEIMNLVVRGSSNRVVIKALKELQEELIQGQGLAKPMSRRWIFLPLMVQMAGVGEETGNLDNTLTTVAQSFEVEADDRINNAIGLIQPIMIIVMAGVVGVIAVAMFAAMYSMYGQINI
jgi:type IV pilus assembly protein PilC